MQVRTYTWGVTDPPPVRSWSTSDEPPSPRQLRTYLIGGPFLNQKNIFKDIRILYSLKYKHSKK